ncbi:DUF3667 domain-containing protein [Flavobacterium sp. AG291]|uniref:DUF3667 domain-containing protein n=1 Tax=Flavobacterium sp. AG291 TaxID=2184000 RepID=UPI000E0CB389|nr:DUF3667 domain-containing protein [Flavobacterium sp. AG291]RDI12121.1 uncharacterized protein DUF3667 [Flavobacterium sp. AG291]
MDTAVNCKSCNEPINKNFCANCGHPAVLKRVDSHYLLHEIQHVLHFEKGIGYTARELLLRPGITVRRFLTEDRSRLIKPIIFIIVTSLVYSVVSHFFHTEIEMPVLYNSAVFKILQWLQGHYGYASIIMGMFIAFFLKLFFRKLSYNLFEILVLLCFVMGIGMLISALFALMEGLTHIELSNTGYLINFLYSIWAITMFFKGKVVHFFKVFVAYITGVLVFAILAILLGVLIDYL